MPQNAEGFGGISMVEYISILFVDTGYHESSQRRGWLKSRFDGKAYADDLTPAEQHRAVQLLRAEKGLEPE
jgi:hypothetical protein